jgi:hypothetical protein
MNTISTLNSAPVAPAKGVPKVQVRPNSALERDGDGDDKVQKAGSKSGGMSQALAQALQSVGLISAPPAANAKKAASTNSTAKVDKATTSANSTGSVKDDVRNFMHALFQAVKSEGATSDAGSSSASTDPKANLSSGLSALISKVSSGAAPASLQAAFDKLALDAPKNSAPSVPTAKLQDLLSQFQQNLGYGNSGSSQAMSNFVNEKV